MIKIAASTNVRPMHVAVMVKQTEDRNKKIYPFSPAARIWFLASLVLGGGWLLYAVLFPAAWLLYWRR